MKILKSLKKQLHNKDYLLLHLEGVLDVIISIHDTPKKMYQAAQMYIVDVVT